MQTKNNEAGTDVEEQEKEREKNMRKSIKKMASLVLASAMALSSNSLRQTSHDNASPRQQRKQRQKQQRQKQVLRLLQLNRPQEGLTVNTTDPITITMSWWGGDGRHEATLAVKNSWRNIQTLPLRPSMQPGPDGKIR